jgi:hypothetical protein
LTVRSNYKKYSNWCIVKHGIPAGSVPGPLLFLLCICDLPTTIISESKPILFTDNTSIIIYHSESDYLQNSINDVLASLNNFFIANILTLNFDKADFLKFATNNKTCTILNIGYDNKTAEKY